MRVVQTGLLMLCVALSTGSCHSAESSLDQLQQHVFGDSYNPVILIEASNQLIHSGGDAAYKSLKRMAARQPDFDPTKEYEIVMLCRMIYFPKSGRFLREPAFGELGDIPLLSMPQKLWPDLPLVLENEIPFLMSTGGYTLGGLPEPAGNYVDYCHKNGIFRDKSYLVPTRGQAGKALTTLLASQRWKALCWKDETPGYGVHGQGGMSYQLSEKNIITGLRTQVANIR